jgi:phosphohistidine phosphatase SixA
MRALMSLPVKLLMLAFALVALASPAQAANIWDELADSDGLVILYRHALAPGGGDPANFDVDDCATQRNLSAAGRRQAVRMGRQLRTRDIPVAEVISSPWCRSRDTARLMRVGPVREMSRLGSVFQSSARTAERRERATTKLIRRHAASDGVLVVVGHQANIIDLTGIAPASGEGVVVRYDLDAGRIDIVGRVPAPSTQ